MIGATVGSNATSYLYNALGPGVSEPQEYQAEDALGILCCCEVRVGPELISRFPEAV